MRVQSVPVIVRGHVLLGAGLDDTGIIDHDIDHPPALDDLLDEAENFSRLRYVASKCMGVKTTAPKLVQSADQI
jgi:hypothetical protein